MAATGTSRTSNDNDLVSNAGLEMQPHSYESSSKWLVGWWFSFCFFTKVPRVPLGDLDTRCRLGIRSEMKTRHSVLLPGFQSDMCRNKKPLLGWASQRLEKRSQCRRLESSATRGPLWHGLRSLPVAVQLHTPDPGATCQTSATHESQQGSWTDTLRCQTQWNTSNWTESLRIDLNVSFGLSTFFMRILPSLPVWLTNCTGVGTFLITHTSVRWLPCRLLGPFKRDAIFLLA